MKHTNAISVFQNQAATISKADNEVRIQCDNPDDAESIFAYLENLGRHNKPISEPWLREVGFTDWGSTGFQGFGIHLAPGWILLCNAERKWMLRGDYLPKQPETRHDIRQLCRVFGVELS